MATLHIETPVYLSGDKVYNNAADAPPDAVKVDPGHFRFVRDMDGIGGWVTLTRRGGLMPECYVPITFGHLLTKVAKHRAISDIYNFAMVRPKPKAAITGVSKANGSGKSSGKVSSTIHGRVLRKVGGFNPFAKLSE